MRFPPGFSLEEQDAECRAKITSKAVIYEVTLLDYTERMDMEANTMFYKQSLNKAKKSEFEMPNGELDEITVNMKIWQNKDEVKDNEEAQKTLVEWV